MISLAAICLALLSVWAVMSLLAQRVLLAPTRH